MFDVEWPRNHPGLSEAIKQARETEIRLAVSNPCFELWLILHFQDHGGWLENNDARRLRRQLDGSTDKSLDAARYLPRIADAVRRAADLDKRHRANGVDIPHNNPSSGMHLLLAAIEPPDVSYKETRA